MRKDAIDDMIVTAVFEVRNQTLHLFDIGEKKMNLSLLVIVFVVGARSSASIDVDNVSGLLNVYLSSINTYLLYCICFWPLM